MMLFALLHYQEIVGVYSSREKAEKAKTIGHVAALEAAGWFIEEWRLDAVAHELENHPTTLDQFLNKTMQAARTNPRLTTVDGFNEIMRRIGLLLAWRGRVWLALHIEELQVHGNAMTHYDQIEVLEG